jgi:hypothetical protein
MSRLLRGDLAAEESLVDPSSGSVVTRRWSPNAIDVDVTLTRPGQLRVNQNYHPGWKSDVGAVYSDHGLIGVRLPAGSSRVGLRFRPRSAIVGGMVTILSIVAFMLLWRRGPGTRIASPIVEVVAASLPLLCGVGLYACLSEPPPERALLVAPTGEPVLASSPPAGSVAVGLDFLDAVTLAASSMPSPDRFVRGEVASLELDWIARGELPREEEVVVRIEGTEGAVWEGSHGLLSAAITLAAAPRNTVLRDIVPLVVPRSLPPGRLDVLVALRNRRTGRLVAGMKSTGPAAERRGAFSLVAQIEPSP